MNSDADGPDSSAETDDSVMRCSEWSRLEDVDPIGTAGSYAGFLLVEWPLPWPRDIAEIPALTELAGVAKRSSVRLQAVLAEPETERSVAYYRWDDSLGSYVGHEAPAGEDPSLTTRTFLEGGNPTGMRPIETVDVLICGHGRRDRCCGSLGTSLEIEVRTSRHLGDGYRVRRTSHTGGHRFAPTAVILAEGTCWGYLDADSLLGILDRSGSPSGLLRHYRGATGLSSPGVQALERAVLEDVGWQLLTWPRRGESLADDRVRLEANPPGGPARVWEATVLTRRMVTAPPCGSPRTGSEKPDRELTVEEVREVEFSA